MKAETSAFFNRIRYLNSAYSQLPTDYSFNSVDPEQFHPHISDGERFGHLPPLYLLCVRSDISLFLTVESRLPTMYTGLTH